MSTLDSIRDLTDIQISVAELDEWDRFIVSLSDPIRADIYQTQADTRHFFQLFIARLRLTQCALDLAAQGIEGAEFEARLNAYEPFAGKEAV